jgi:TPR repeat protein
MQIPLRSVWVVGVIALFAYGVYAPSSHGQSHDEKKLLKLQAQAQRGVVTAEAELADHYLKGNGVPRDAALAAHWYEKAAQSGNVNAQNWIGYFYQTGVGVPVDLSRALHWYQLAAASGSSDGKLNLGILYLSGLGVRKDIPFAMQLFEEAARKGDGIAACFLGDIYYFGLTGTRDLPTAEKWFQMGVELHDPMAAYHLGELFSVTTDHPHDFRKAADLLRRSVESGYVPAMHSLGLLLFKHPEIKQAEHESTTLLETAANAGEWRSSVLLGIRDRDGKGVPVDKKSAIYHFQIAVLQGGDEAEHFLRHEIDLLSGLLDEDERVGITSAARAWYVQHPSAQLFVVGNRSQARYFELNIGPKAVMRTFVQGGTPVGNLTAAERDHSNQQK